MSNKNYTLTIIFLLFLGFFSYHHQLHAQNAYFFIGLGAEKFDNIDPFKTIINDYNNYHTANKFDFNNLKSPEILHDYTFGIKMNLRHSSLIYDFHMNRIKSVVKGWDSTGYNSIYKKMIVVQGGFLINYNFNIISTKYFRTGPGLVFNLEQFVVKVKSTSDVHAASVKSINDFLLSGSVRYTISMGGPKFNFDIIPYYHYPFWSINLQNLNKDINNGYEKDYTKQEMTFKPVSMGVLLKFCFGFQANE